MNVCCPFLDGNHVGYGANPSNPSLKVVQGMHALVILTPDRI